MRKFLVIGWVLVFAAIVVMELTIDDGLELRPAESGRSIPTDTGATWREAEGYPGVLILVETENEPLIHNDVQEWIFRGVMSLVMALYVFRHNAKAAHSPFSGPSPRGRRSSVRSWWRREPGGTGNSAHSPQPLRRR